MPELIHELTPRNYPYESNVDSLTHTSEPVSLYTLLGTGLPANATKKRKIQCGFDRAQKIHSMMNAQEVFLVIIPSRKELCKKAHRGAPTSALLVCWRLVIHRLWFLVGMLGGGTSRMHVLQQIETRTTCARRKSCQLLRVDVPHRFSTVI